MTDKTTTILSTSKYAGATPGEWRVTNKDDVTAVVARRPWDDEEKKWVHPTVLARGYTDHTICDNEPYYPCGLEEGNAPVIADAKLNAAKAIVGTWLAEAGEIISRNIAEAGTITSDNIERLRAALSEWRALEAE